jgi:hypothetical protein
MVTQRQMLALSTPQVRVVSPVFYPEPEVEPPPPGSEGEFRTVISQVVNGRTFTITFDRAYLTGQFVDGSWWVTRLTPDGLHTHVRIESVSPAWGAVGTDGTMANGTMLEYAWTDNLKQGFCDIWKSAGIGPGGASVAAARHSKSNYDVARRFAIPGNVIERATGKHSVIFSRTKSGPWAPYGPPPNYSSEPKPTAGSGEGQLPWLSAPCVLTVLAAPPPANAFRPHPYKVDFDWVTLSDVDFTLLDLRLPTTIGTTLEGVGQSSAPTPTLTARLALHTAPRVEIMGYKKSLPLHPNGDIRQYLDFPNANGGISEPRDIAVHFNISLLRLLMDYTPAEAATHRALAIALIQNGIDYKGWIDAGAGWGYTTGHQGVGFFTPVLLLAYLTNDASVYALTEDTLEPVSGPRVTGGARFRFMEVNKCYILRNSTERSYGYDGVLHPDIEPDYNPIQQVYSYVVKPELPPAVYRGRTFAGPAVYGDRVEDPYMHPTRGPNASNWAGYDATGNWNAFAGGTLAFTMMGDVNVARGKHSLADHPIERAKCPLHFMLTDDSVNYRRPLVGAPASQRILDPWTRRCWDNVGGPSGWGRANYVSNFPIWSSVAQKV